MLPLQMTFNNDKLLTDLSDDFVTENLLIIEYHVLRSIYGKIKLLAKFNLHQHVILVKVPQNNGNLYSVMSIKHQIN